MNDEEVIEYYHRGVVFHLVGFPIAMPLDVEMIRPGEGEVIAAKRLLERVLLCYGRFFDVALADAIYTEAPFYNLCLQHPKHVISVLKGEQRVVFQDAQGVFSLMKPNTWKEGRSHIRAWDAEGFTTADTQVSKTKGRARNGSAFFIYFTPEYSFSIRRCSGDP